MQDILTNGKTINDELGKKLESLNNTNANFNTVLTNKLNEIIKSIDNFKNTNLQGLNETKTKLEEVTKELQTTKDTLQQTQAELDRVKNSLAESQNQLQAANATKMELEQREKELNDRLTQLETEYNNKIAGIRDEMSKQATEEKKAMQQEFDNQMANLNAEKDQLKKDIQDAQAAQNDATNKLAELQKEQEGLLANLATVNTFLTQQLEMINRINIGQPNMNDYTGLLDTIQNGLGGVITKINQAVAGPPASSTPLYDKYMKLTSEQQSEIINSLESKYRNEMLGNNKQNIQNILSRYYNGNLLKGGKRKRRTMKKRARKTMKRRKQRGGYVYSTSRDLDRASSIISSSSRATSKSSRNKRHTKTKSIRY